MGLELMVLLGKAESNRGDDIGVFSLFEDRVPITKGTPCPFYVDLDPILPIDSLTAFKNIQ